MSKNHGTEKAINKMKFYERNFEVFWKRGKHIFDGVFVVFRWILLSPVDVKNKFEFLWNFTLMKLRISNLLFSWKYHAQLPTAVIEIRINKASKIYAGTEKTICDQAKGSSIYDAGKIDIFRPLCETSSETFL